MNLADGRQLARQQLSQAELLLDQLEDCHSLPLRRAFLQGALLSINLGLEQYFSAVFGVSVKTGLLNLAAMPKSASPSSAQEEYYALMEEGEWMYALSQAVTSMAMLPNNWEAVSVAKQANVIASTAQASYPHWSKLDSTVVSRWIAKSAELLERHDATDQEY